MYSTVRKRAKRTQNKSMETPEVPHMSARQCLEELKTMTADLVILGETQLVGYQQCC